MFIYNIILNKILKIKLVKIYIYLKMHKENKIYLK